MKKFVIALVLAGGIGAIAYGSYASLNNNSKNKQGVEKKAEKKEKKKECKRTCLFS